MACAIGANSCLVLQIWPKAYEPGGQRPWWGSHYSCFMKGWIVKLPSKYLYPQMSVHFSFQSGKLPSAGEVSQVLRINDY